MLCSLYGPVYGLQLAALLYIDSGFIASDASAFHSLCRVGNGIGAFAAHRRPARLAHRTVSVAGRVKPDPAKSNLKTDRNQVVGTNRIGVIAGSTTFFNDQPRPCLPEGCYLRFSYAKLLPRL